MNEVPKYYLEQKQTRGFEFLNRELTSNKALHVLDADGVTPRDIAALRTMQDAGFSVFMHGSGITGKLNENSDIDFAVIGDLTKMPLSLRNEFIPGLDNDFLKSIDYTSVSLHAANGRKLSFHLENEHFRLQYPGRTYGIEYRQLSHQKSDGSSQYTLAGISADGDIHVFNIKCPQIPYNDGLINLTPQTGIFHIQGGKGVPANEFTPEFSFESIICLDGTTGLSKSFDNSKPKEFAILGLELNKMSEDTPLEAVGNDTNHDLYITQPLARNMQLINEFTNGDPVERVIDGIKTREELRVKKTGKIKITDDFLNDLRNKLQDIQNTPKRAKIQGQMLI